jgi:hypothetical protein
MPPAPEIILRDPRMRLTFGEPQCVLHDGLQPFLLGLGDGTLVLQAQLSTRPPPAERLFFPFILRTMVSHDGGVSWTHRCDAPNESRFTIEGGAVVLCDGSVLALDTYVTPGPQPGTGIGSLYHSTAGWRTLSGPKPVTFNLPKARFHGSTDDAGQPHPALRLHRRILELPDGDLLTTLYGWQEGDDTPVDYMPTMKKMRVILMRSRNRGRHWDLVSTVAADPTVGTEGFNEPALVRLRHGPNVGRLICLMRTGRELREAVSDDEGLTWSAPVPRIYAGLDVYRTELWSDMFCDTKAHDGALIAGNPVEMIGAVVDPDLIELRSGVLVAAFGLRVPPRMCWPHAQHPWNGNYLAFSLDHGATWSHVARLTSGLPTTHNLAIEELPGTNRLYVAYDSGYWSVERTVLGCTVQINLTSKYA